ncbi:Protein tilB, partial [Kappamyces sp. JEL0680]
QFDIEKIENLDVYCRNLEILFLQSNQISKIENLHRLKRLEYLQLALNNIKVVENLEGCESLKKLDLTVNFVDDLLCLESLKNNEQLRQLYLVGNPCAEKEGYRSFVIATLPQLTQLDGRDIEKSERIVAMQEYPKIRARLLADSASQIQPAAPEILAESLAEGYGSSTDSI